MIRPHPLVEIAKELKEIRVCRSQTFTVWLVLNDPDGKQHNIQLEIRITDKGVPELFSTEKLNIKSFKKWSKLE